MALFNETWVNKWNQFKYDSQTSFDRKCQYMKSWWQENHEWAIVIIPVAAATTVKVVNIIGKAYTAHEHTKAAQIDSRTMWDPVKQIHVMTKRPMSRVELEDYMRLTRNGMTTSDALMTLNLI